MLTIRHERPSDAAAREALLDAAYGAVRFEKPSERLRAGRKPADGLSFVAVDDGRLVGTARLWDLSIGPNCPALLLGPLAVAPDCRRRGIGSALMRRVLLEAGRRGHRAVLLVGDASYYGRFGFSAECTGKLWLPGLAAPHRLLGRELAAGALDGARGVIGVPRQQTTAPPAQSAGRARPAAPQAA